ncbi:MAG: hypothetical protein A2Y16_05570 [Tenericutes bacterium GWF2_57_13]|nr:MAG: hypothetical protein A2Y16_05570 [Tenericutes bacterium GWF2_57_13]
MKKQEINATRVNNDIISYLEDAKYLIQRGLPLTAIERIFAASKLVSSRDFKEDKPIIMTIHCDTCDHVFSADVRETVHCPNCHERIPYDPDADEQKDDFTDIKQALRSDAVGPDGLFFPDEVQ